MNKNKEDNKKKNYTGTIVWYMIFLGVIPYLLKSTSYFIYYIPMIDMIANVFGSAKNSHHCPDLYTPSPDNIVNFTSSNLINLIALGGVALWYTLCF